MIIALTGSAGVGKSTIAAMLENKFSLKRHRLAGPLKDMMRALYAYAGIPEQAIEARIEGNLKEMPDTLLCGKTPRHAMQTLGTEWRDMIGRELWSRIWEIEARKGNIVVEDCRFEHEYDHIKALGGWVVQVVRDEAPGTVKHSSEAGLPKRCHIDWTIYNNGSSEDLAVQVDTMWSLLPEKSSMRHWRPSL